MSRRCKFTFHSNCFNWLSVKNKLFFCQPIEHPVRTNQIPRQIPEQSFYIRPLPGIVMGGVLPFGCIFIQLFFILNSIWYAYHFYPALHSQQYLVCLPSLSSCSSNSTVSVMHNIFIQLFFILNSIFIQLFFKLNSIFIQLFFKLNSIWYAQHFYPAVLHTQQYLYSAVLHSQHSLYTAVLHSQQSIYTAVFHTQQCLFCLKNIG